MVDDQATMFIVMAFVFLVTIPLITVALISIIIGRKVKNEQKMKDNIKAELILLISSVFSILNRNNHIFKCIS